jgi:uncharacterized protein (DUF2249 family)
MKPQLVELDVREEIRKGCEPFSKIMSAVAPLEAGDQLLLIAPFEPLPLFEVLKKQGFRHTKRPTDSGDWEVLFTRESTCLQKKSNNSAAAHPTAPSSVVDVDARGLEPPQPLVKILETVAELPEGAMLRARTDRRPMHLYAHLADRGFTAETQEQADGSFLTHIRRQ